MVLILLMLAAPPAVPGYPIGVFVPLAGLEQASAAGFEFAEIGLRDAVALPDDELERLVARSRTLKLPILAAINFLPPTLKVVGPDIDKTAQNDYLARALVRAKRLGIKTVVFGSGKSRRSPDGFSRQEAFRQLVEFGQRAAGEAKKHGVVIAIEPLGSDETNTINSVEEGVALVQAIGHPSFGIAVDYYHLTLAHESPAVLVKTRNHLRHVRIANPNGRAFPLAAAESDYAAFFHHLVKIGYRGGIGVEARTGTLAAEGPRSVAFLRGLAAKLSAKR